MELLALISLATLVGLISVAGILATLIGIVAIATLIGQLAVTGMLVTAAAFRVLLAK